MISGRLGLWLFPDPPRDFAGRRKLKIGLRGAHVLCSAALFGAHLFSQPQPDATPWLYATLLSGLALLLLDLHESAAFLLQARGAVVVAKLLLLAALPWLEGLEAWVLGTIVAVSVLSSHASGRFRYRLLAGGGTIAGGRSKG